MRLNHPASDTKMFRRKAQGDRPAGNWHFLKIGRLQIGQCGTLVSIDGPLNETIEYATLGEIRHGKICPSCWPWGLMKNA